MQRLRYALLPLIAVSAVPFSAVQTGCTTGGSSVSVPGASRDAAAIVAAARSRFTVAVPQMNAQVPATRESILAAADARTFHARGGKLVAELRAGKTGSALKHSADARLGLHANDPFTLESEGTAVAVSMHNASTTAAEQTDGYVVYKDALVGADALHRVTAEGTEDYVVFNNAPERAELSYDVKLTEGVAGLRLVANTLEILDANGTPKLRVNSPYGVDANGERFEASLTVSGCAVDTNPQLPMGRAVTPAGAAACTVHVSWSATVAYPAMVDPAWIATGSMSVNNPSHEMPIASLSGGKVLAVSNSVAQVYDPATGVWTMTGSPVYGMSHRSRIVGITGDQAWATTNNDPTQLYDLATGVWKATTNLPNTFTGDGSGMLHLGANKVLVSGGSGATYIYDATTDTYAARASSTQNFGFNPGMYFVGGTKYAVTTGSNSTISIYDTATDTWSYPASQFLFNENMNCGNLELLTDGKILSFGGGSGTNAGRIFDPVTDTTVDVVFPGPFMGYMCSHTAAISYGKIHLIGSGRFSFDEATGVVTDLGVFASGALMHGAIVKLKDGRGLAVGGNASYPNAFTDVYAAASAADCSGPMFGGSAMPSFDPASHTCKACDGDNGGASPLKCATAGAPACQTGNANALAGQCTQCSSTNEALCQGLTPRCNVTTGACGACNGGLGVANATRACKSAVTPVCKVDGSCVAANGDFGLQGGTATCPTAANPYVKNDGTCGTCAANADCAGATHTGPICNMVSGSCGTSCVANSDCSSSQFCDLAGTKTCAPKKAGGATCAGVTECASASCTATKCDTACTVAADCTGSTYCDTAASPKICKANKADGALCTLPAECATAQCTAGKCGAPTVIDAGAPDTGAADSGTKDAGNPATDAGTADSGTATNPTSNEIQGGGCGCHTTSRRGQAENGFGFLVAAAAVLSTLRRKQNRKPAH